MIRPGLKARNGSFMVGIPRRGGGSLMTDSLVHQARVGIGPTGSGAHPADQTPSIASSCTFCVADWRRAIKGP